MKKILTIIAIIAILIIGMSTFTYYYESTHPTKDNKIYRTVSPIDEAKYRLDSLKRAELRQKEWERIKAAKRYKDSIKQLQQVYEKTNPYEEGLEEGREEGYEEGYEKGYEEGLEDGRKE